MANEAIKQNGPPRPAGAPPRPGGMVTTAAAPPKRVIPWPAIEWKGERDESVIHPDMKGLVVVTSFFGHGKSTFAFGADCPANVMILDYESKGESIAKQLGIENYFRPAADCGRAFDSVEYDAELVYTRTKMYLDQMPKDRFTVLVVDGLSTLQKGISAAVEEDPTSYGVKQYNIDKNAYGGPYPGVSLVVDRIANIAQGKGVQVIVLTTELGDKWDKTGPLLNKFDKKGVKKIDQLSVLTVLLQQPGYPQYDGAPSAIVMKEQLALHRWSKEEKRAITIKRIPPKLPCCTWPAIYTYLDGVLDMRKLKPEEVPTKAELQPFTPVIEGDQIQAMLKLMEAQAKMRTEEG